jgi:heme a synthase
MRSRLAGLEVTPKQFQLACAIALGALTVIVFTGAAVRVTGSGLGCPTWPQCYDDGRLVAQTDTHALIEFGNRMLTFFVGLAAFLPLVAARFRRPYRRDLRNLALLLPLGVLAQAVLGGITVRLHLAPVTVMGHFALSMVVITTAFWLWWRARPELDGPHDRIERTGDRRLALGTRAMCALGALVVLLGTAATAAGPHAGGAGTGDDVDRFYFRGPDTLDFLIHRHAYAGAALGLAAAALWWAARRTGADGELRRTLLRITVLMAAQGVLGPVQYLLELPAELVWVHVVLASLLWVGISRAWFEAGEIVPTPARARSAAVAA